MISASKAVFDANRADFERLHANVRSKLFNGFYQLGVESPEWWGILVGEDDPPYR